MANHSCSVLHGSFQTAIENRNSIRRQKRSVSLMTVEGGVRLMAGVMVLLSVALAHFISLYWLWLTVFVGLNLLQSAFTNWCPAITMLRAIGLKDAK